MLIIRGLVPCLLLLLAALFAAQFLQFRGVGRSNVDGAAYHTLASFQKQVQQCVARNGLGLMAYPIDHCKLIFKFHEGTNSTWYNEKFKIYEPLEYILDVCDALLTWEQYRNVTTILTREYLEARSDGWLEYAAKRISQLGSDKCYNKTKCEEELQLVLPPRPPFRPRQFAKCAVVGNSGDLLKTEFGKEIDEHDIVIRDNEAPVTKKYAKYVGMKRSIRILGRGIARNMKKFANGSADEVLVIKSLIHRDFNTMIKELPNPVYLFHGIVFRRGAKGTGVKSIELALSMCDEVDIYGFTVDPGYTEWTRYFSSPRKGHNPLQGRAYYQLLECLGVIRIHSPMREERKQDWAAIPGRSMIARAYSAALILKKGLIDNIGPLSSCKIWGTAQTGSLTMSGSLDMSELRRNSNYSKWERVGISDLRLEARAHIEAVKGVTFYKLDGNKLDDLLCIRRNSKSKM